MASILYDYQYNLNKTISKPYIYKDLSLSSDSTNADINKNIGSLTDIEAVKSGLSNIFSFHPGERILLPDFGNGLYKYLYEPINDYTSTTIGEEILTMITRWEPRVKILNVNVEAVPDDNEYRISIYYTIPTLTNQTIQFNKVIRK